MPTPEQIAAMTHQPGDGQGFGFGQFTADPNFANPMSAPIPAVNAPPPGVPVGLPPMGVQIPPQIQAPVPGQPPPMPVPPMAAPAPVPVTGNAPRPARAGSGGGGGRPGPADPMAGLETDMVKAGAAEKAALGEKVSGLEEAGAREQKALGDAAQLREIQGEELRVKQEQTAKINAKLDADDIRNLELAKSKTIPDFWEGKEGDRLGSVIAVALTGAGNSLTGRSGNEAMTAIQHNIDGYFQRQKDTIDNLFKSAAAAGKINDQIRHSYASQLLDLKEQHTYGLEAARDRIAQVAAESKNVDAIAQAKLLSAGLDKQIIQDRMAVRKLRGDLELQKAQVGSARASAAASYANAEESRAGAALKRAQADQEGKGLPKNVTGEMLKSQGFADTAKANDQIISSTPISAAGIRTILADMAAEENYNKNPGAKQVAITTGLYKTLEQKLSPQDQRAMLAARQFINADLRRESGAAIGASEFQSAFSRYFPAAGDNAATIRQKAYNRAQSIHSMEIAGGLSRGGQPVQEQAQPQGQIPIGARATSGGKPIVMTAQGWQLAQ